MDSSKLSGNSADITEEQKTKLRELFPEVFSEDKIDWQKLKASLGEEIELGEQYGLSWKGKSDVFRTIQEPTTKTLKPVRDESVNFDETENVFIEGDNLEALKILQKAYYGKIKMIYIDPPYNTGNDFVYNDKFAQKRTDYEQEAGLRDENGQVTRVDGLRPNRRDGGHYHSNWLNMMYPRLYLARNLLRQDGAIFVSIDDTEIHNLRHVMNEIFGEENYIATLTVQTRYEGKTLVEDADIQKTIENVLVYGRSGEFKLKKEKADYDLEKYCWQVVEKGNPHTIELGSRRVDVFASGQFDIVKVEAGESNLKEIWASGKILDGNSSGRFFRDYITGRYRSDGYGVLYKVYGIGGDDSPFRYFTGPKKDGATKGKYYQGVPSNIVGNVAASKRFLPVPDYLNFADAFGNSRLEGDVDFRNGKKPLAFLKQLINLCVEAGDPSVILDFFAGSGSTAHAVMQLNAEDNGRRSWICVQLPEETDQKSDAWHAGFENIAELTKERFRRSGRRILEQNDSVDIGFRSMRVNETNFKVWDNSVNDRTRLKQQMLDHLNPVKDNSNEEDILAELALKSGIDLMALPKKVESPGGVYYLFDGSLAICLEVQLSSQLFEDILSARPKRVILLDSSLHNDDQLKTNFLLRAEKQGVEVTII